MQLDPEQLFQRFTNKINNAHYGDDKYYEDGPVQGLVI